MVFACLKYQQLVNHACNSQSEGIQHRVNCAIPPMTVQALRLFLQFFFAANLSMVIKLTKQNKRKLTGAV